MPFLLPGIGAQGATVADLSPAFVDGLALVSASRSVIFAESPADEARRLAREVWDAAQAA
jgi:orotidine-5'-phosphate decarboxylase